MCVVCMGPTTGSSHFWSSNNNESGGPEAGGISKEGNCQVSTPTDTCEFRVSIILRPTTREVPWSYYLPLRHPDSTLIDALSGTLTPVPEYEAEPNRPRRHDRRFGRMIQPEQLMQ